uniref:Reverse transcriptase zinc-binding domain-containing protein n=1 Tax=Nicotiana tabacum TaxID=4097 RepID=A0A1S4AIH8_TOBAC|nr:PREDICTED: uncharacterized protein LOC107797822 [Nicotiana tabacum]
MEYLSRNLANLKMFTQVSGLQANLNKSEAYFEGVPTEDRQQILQLLGLSTGELPFKYLGVPLSTKKLSVLQWQPLLDKMTVKITSWTAKTLSYARRMNTLAIPQQACWMVRKVIEAKEILEARHFVQLHNRSLIRQIYLHLLGDYNRVEWKSLMFNNAARPKAKFIMWLMMYGRLMTCNRLSSWKIIVDTQCVMCRKQVETRDHLFVQCEYTK